MHERNTWRALAAAAHEASRRGIRTVAERRQLFIAAANGALIWDEAMRAQYRVPVCLDAACCWRGRVVPCVCARSTDCPTHGRRCEGSHE